jgi:copper(I)-binding protein
VRTAAVDKALKLGLMPPLVLAAACVHGDAGTGVTAPRVSIERAIVVNATEAGAETAAYAVFVNAGQATSIVDAECSCADSLELHLVQREGPNAGMAKAWPLALPADSRTAITPPGVPRHLMLVRTKRTIATGDRLTLRFKFEDGTWIEESFVGVPSSTEAWLAFDERSGG